MVWNLWPAWIMFMWTFSCNFNEVSHYISIFGCLINSALHIRLSILHTYWFCIVTQYSYIAILLMSSTDRPKYTGLFIVTFIKFNCHQIHQRLDSETRQFLCFSVVTSFNVSVLPYIFQSCSECRIAQALTNYICAFMTYSKSQILHHTWLFSTKYIL